MKSRLIVIVLICLLLCGCSYTEPDSRYTVTAVGFEQSGEKVRAMVRVIDAANGEKGGDPDTFTVVGEGKNLIEAAERLSASLSKKPSFGHCGILVIAENCDIVFIEEVLELCNEGGIPKRTRVSVCNNVEGLLSEKSPATGEELAGLINSAGEDYGIGSHSAFFEIETALLLSQDFALPRFFLSDKVSLGGLLTYQNGKPSQKLNLKESAKYLKQKGMDR